MSDTVEITAPPSVDGIMDDDEIHGIAEKLTGGGTHVFNRQDSAAILQTASTAVSSVAAVDPFASSSGTSEPLSLLLPSTSSTPMFGDSNSEDEEEDEEEEENREMLKMMKNWERRAERIANEGTFSRCVLALIRIGVTKSIDRKILENNLGTQFTSIMITEKNMTPTLPPALTEDAKKDPDKLLEIIVKQQKTITHQQNYTRFVNTTMTALQTYAQEQYKIQQIPTPRLATTTQRVLGKQGSQTPIAQEFKELQHSTTASSQAAQPQKKAESNSCIIS